MYILKKEGGLTYSEIAICATLIDKHIVSYNFIIIGLIIGSVIGLYLAITVKMTQMPQMVGLLNGFGGLASSLIAISEYDSCLPLGNLLSSMT